jgi:thioredoxin reductase
MLFDVIAIGGSYAGMAAAMQIARRNVLIIDAGLRRGVAVGARRNSIVTNNRS